MSLDILALNWNYKFRTIGKSFPSWLVRNETISHVLFPSFQDFYFLKNGESRIVYFCSLSFREIEITPNNLLTCDTLYILKFVEDAKSRNLLEILFTFDHNQYWLFVNRQVNFLYYQHFDAFE